MTSAPVSPARPGRRRSIATLVSTAVLVTTLFAAGSRTATALDDGDWLGIVNTYRAMSGLSPVTGNAGWSGEAQAHSCYMLQNGITHDEIPGRPGYTAGGDTAGNHGNVAVSSSVRANARQHVDLWMTGPFHAIGILRHNLTSSGYGQCNDADTPTPWHSAGTLDVIRGLDGTRQRPPTPIVFPGSGATVPLHSFIAESPNPVTMCGWTGTAGLPLIAMMPVRVTGASATLTGPNGPLETCVLHAGNTTSTARAILDGERAVVVMPRQSLANGTYTVNVTSDGGTASWSFTVDRTAPLSAAPPATPAKPAAPATTAAPAAPKALPTATPSSKPVNLDPVEPHRIVDSRRGLGTTRLRAGTTVRIQAAPADVAALSANFVAIAPVAPGHLTVFACTDKVPEVSTIGYAPGDTVANQAIVPLRDGAFCMTALTDIDVVVDVNGYYRSGGTDAQFKPIRPERMYDSRRAPGRRLAAGVERSVTVAGVPGGAPSGVSAVSLNVTAIASPQHGHLQVYPCGSTRSLETSTINYAPGEVRPNTVVVAADATGRICLRSLRDVDVAIDITGYFAPGAGYEFTPLSSIRIFDSRRTDRRLNDVTGGARIPGGKEVRIHVAGVRGIPAAKAASVNLTVTGSSAPLHLTAYPCGPRPATSNLNVGPGRTAANGAVVALSPDGDLCVVALRDVHLIVDINGVWS